VRDSRYPADDIADYPSILKTPPCLVKTQPGCLIPHMQCGSHNCVLRSCRTASRIDSATPRSKFTGCRLDYPIINNGVAFGILQRLNYPPTAFPSHWRRVFPRLEELSTRHPGTAAQDHTLAPIREAGRHGLADTAPHLRPNVHPCRRTLLPAGAEITGCDFFMSELVAGVVKRLSAALVRPETPCH
jgi:hypothetical protein